jgi:hypothetical protein
MPIGWEVGCLLRTWTVAVQKHAMLPLSAIAMESSGGIGRGPTRDILETQKAEYSSVKTLGYFVVFRSIGAILVVGSPHRQCGMAAAAM